MEYLSLYCCKAKVQQVKLDLLMVECTESELVDMQHENSSLTNQAVSSLLPASAAEDEADGNLLEPPHLINNVIQPDAFEDEETESFSLLGSLGTGSQEQQNSLQGEPQIIFSVDPVNEFMMFYYNSGGEIREEIIENSLVMLVTIAERYEMFERPESHFEEQSHLNINNIIAQTQQQYSFDDDEASEPIFTEENTGARRHYQVQHQNFIQQSSLEDEPSELVFSVDPVNEFIMFHYNLSEDMEGEPID